MRCTSARAVCYIITGESRHKRLPPWPVAGEGGHSPNALGDHWTFKGFFLQQYSTGAHSERENHRAKARAHVESGTAIIDRRPS